TSRARIFPLTLTNEPAKGEERGEKGRLKTPSRLRLIHAAFDNNPTLIIQYGCMYSDIAGFCKSNINAFGVPSAACLTYPSKTLYGNDKALCRTAAEARPGGEDLRTAL